MKWELKVEDVGSGNMKWRQKGKAGTGAKNTRGKKNIWTPFKGQPYRHGFLSPLVSGLVEVESWCSTIASLLILSYQ
jgi:hypothetical protein